MEVPKSLYSWLQRFDLINHKPSQRKDKYVLHQEDTHYFKLGLNIALMLETINEAPVVPPNCLKSKDSVFSMSHNWRLIIASLEDFGLSIDKTLREGLIVGDGRSMVDLLTKLRNKEEKLNEHKEFTTKLEEFTDESSLDQSKTAFEFLIKSFIKNFGLSGKQILGLFAQNRALLSHVFNKGIKKNHIPVLNWLEEIKSNLSFLHDLIDTSNSEEFMGLFLECLAKGLHSNNFQVAVESLKTFKMTVCEFKDIKDFLWNWSVDNKLIEQIFSLFDRSRVELSETVFEVLYEIGRKRLVLLFSDVLYRYLGNEYFNAMWYFLVEISKQSHLVKVIEIQDLIEHWITLSLSTCHLNFSKPFAHRIPPLMLIFDVWGKYPSFLSDNYCDSIIRILTKVYRDKSLVCKVLLFGRTFELICSLTGKNDKYALILYKMLTFLLVENFNEELIRQFIFRNLVDILKEIPSLPLSVFLDPIIKQLQFFKGLNLSDFDCLQKCIDHPDLEIKHASLILEITSIACFEDFVHHNAAQHVFLLIVNRFIDDKNIQITVKNIIKNRLSRIEKLISPQNTKLYQMLVIKLSKSLIEASKILEHILKEVLKVSDSKYFKQTGNHIHDIYTVIEYVPPIKDTIEPSTSRPYSLDIIPKGKVMDDIQKALEYRKAKEAHRRSLTELQSIRQNKIKGFLRKNNEIRKIAFNVNNRGAILVKNKDAYMKDEARSDKYVNISNETQQDQMLYSIVAKRYNKLNKLLFDRYSVNSVMREGDAVKLLRDHTVSKNILSVESIVQIFTHITVGNSMDFTKFVEFLYLVSLQVFSSRSTRDLSLFPTSISFLSLYSLFSNSNIFPKRYYLEPDAGTGDQEVIATLNSMLKDDPYAKLPDGYEKVKDYKIRCKYTAPAPEPMMICLEILDEICNKAIGFHILLPLILIEEAPRAKCVLKKPSVVSKDKLSIVPSNRASYNSLPLPSYLKLSPHIKLEVSKLAGSYRNETLVEIARTVDDLVYSTEKGSSFIISKAPRRAKSITNAFRKEREYELSLSNFIRNRNESRRRKHASDLKKQVAVIQAKKELLKYEEELKIERERAAVLEKRRMANQMIRDKLKYALSYKKANAISPDIRESPLKQRKSVSNLPPQNKLLEPHKKSRSIQNISHKLSKYMK